jgi:hypothetical protein
MTSANDDGDVVVDAPNRWIAAVKHQSLAQRPVIVTRRTAPAVTLRDAAPTSRAMVVAVMVSMVAFLDSTVINLAFAGHRARPRRRPGVAAMDH